MTDAHLRGLGRKHYTNKAYQYYGDVHFAEVEGVQFPIRGGGKSNPQTGYVCRGCSARIGKDTIISGKQRERHIKDKHRLQGADGV